MVGDRRRRYTKRSVIIFSGKQDNNGDEEEAWDANVDYEKEWPEGGTSPSATNGRTPDPSTAWDDLPNMPSDLTTDKLGIDLKLEPLTQREAEKLKADAQQVINKAIDDGIQDIEKLRQKMNREIQASKRALQFASELEAEQQQQQLMNKIDSITNSFLQQTEASRVSTQTAAAASRAMEGTGRGIEMGTWGVLDGKTVLAEDVGSSISLLGSVENAKKQGTNKSTKVTQPQPKENRILFIADTKQVRITCIAFFSD
jgi:hypothetical protein